MSSNVIVLDSSDEDEAPAKRPLMGRVIPATIRPVKRSATPVSTAGNRVVKARAIPSGITVTRHSPVLCTVSGNAPIISSKLLSAVTTNIAKPQLPILPKINAAFTLNTAERKTNTPPARPPVRPAVAQVRKRKTPTPPQTPTPLSTSPAMVIVSTNSTAIITPTITTVQSLAPSATPPLQLMATPPHTAASLTDQLMINQHLIHTSLPQSTTITLQTTMANKTNNNNAPSNFISNTPNSNNSNSSSTTTLNNNNNSTVTNNKSNNNNSNNNNSNTSSNKTPNSAISFKIQLPPKRLVTTTTSTTTTSSPISSPVLKTTPVASPIKKIPTAAASPILKTPPIATLNPIAKVTPVETDKLTKRVKPTTILKATDVLWRQRPLNAVTLTDKMFLKLVPSPKCSPEPAKLTPPAANTPLSLAISPQPQTSPKITSSPTAVITKITPAERVTPMLDLTKTEESTPKDTTVVAVVSNEKNNGESPKKSTPLEKAAVLPEYEALIKACRDADSTPDMEKLISSKLLKYYHEVHPEFVKSRGFRKNLCTVTERIRADPDLVYYNLKTIVDELKVRRKSKEVYESEEEESSSTTGNKHTDEQIKKLNKALYILTKRIEKLEESDVDWDDEDSSYLQVERFKKRACQIYEKICDLTGENKSAHRLVRKPIQFNDTEYPQYNKTVQAFVNRTREFPDYQDVLRMLEHCNRQYNYGLIGIEMKRIAHEAFTKVGKLLQSRRKTDLYETVTHYTANSKDPAATDPELLAKLSENQKNQTKISDILEKYAREQDMTAEEQKEARMQQKLKLKINDDDEPKISESDLVNPVDEEETDDESEDDDANDLEEDVNKLANGELSDGDSDVELTIKKKEQKMKVEMKTSETESSKKPISIDENCEKTTKTMMTTATTTTATTMKVERTPKLCDKTENDVKENNLSNNVNNLARTKTGDAAHSTESSNSDVKPIEQNSITTNGNANNTQRTNTITRGPPIRLVSALRIINVATLNGSIGANNTKLATSNISKETSVTSTVTRTATTLTTTATTTPPMLSGMARQRTVAEIVISDEES